MSLVGLPVVVVLSVLTVALPLTAVLAWRRVRGPRVVRALQRLGLVVGAQLSAVLLVLVGLNDYGNLFTSWSQAFDSLTAPHDVRTIAAESARDGDVRGFGVPSGFVAGRPFGGGRPAPGRSIELHIRGTVSGLASTARVYLPPAYDAGARRLPVVLALTGFPGSPLELTHRLHYPEFLAADVARHLATPAVLVLMQPAPVYPRDTECANVPHGPQVLSFLGEDVPDAVIAQLHLRPTGFGAIGDSTGGYCALKLAMMLPGRFHAAASLSGYYQALQDATTGDIYGGSPVVRSENDLLWRLEHRPIPRVALFLATSRTERGTDGYATQQRFLDAVRPPMSAEEFVLRHGLGHSPATWIREIPTALSWLSWELGHRRWQGGVVPHTGVTA
jgi:S-formylglutathione hydrolase FrmB